MAGKKITRDEAEQLIYYEASLIDGRRFEEWLDLFTEDAVYWIPNWREDSNPGEDGVIIYEKKREMEARVARLMHPAAFTQEPPPRTRHLITNVLLKDAPDGQQRVVCNFLVFGSRGSRQTQFVGGCEYGLTKSGDKCRINHKKVFLINNDQPIDTLPIL